MLYSSAFRRLLDKTQVFPLGRNDYVRTRMTHSLEVANVGRTLAKKLHQIVCEEEPGPHPSAESLEDIVATVCLAHDIGNPPFGHSGEAAINTALEEFDLKELGLQGYEFEGNAQGFRLLSKVCDPIGGFGLDLTAATLAAFTKYPCTAGVEQEIYKKVGISAEESATFCRVAELCELTPLGSAPGVWARHPLALLMEAADDISYLIADVEDAYFSQIISYEECIEQLGSMATSWNREKYAQAVDAHDRAGKVHMARAIAVGSCIDSVSAVLKERYADIMSGSFTGSLMKHTERSRQYEQVKRFSVSRIYNHESVLRIEIAGFNVLRKLLELYMSWVTEPQSPRGRRIGDILHAPANCTEPRERFLHVIDYVSGMTDSYAQHTYNKLYGREQF